MLIFPKIECPLPARKGTYRTSDSRVDPPPSGWIKSPQGQISPFSIPPGLSLIETQSHLFPAHLIETHSQFAPRIPLIHKKDFPASNVPRGTILNDTESQSHLGPHGCGRFLMRPSLNWLRTCSYVHYCSYVH
jgi:hypothetical protein